MRRLLIRLMLLLPLLGFAAPAQALLSTCTTLAVGVTFGNYNPISATPTDSTGEVSVICVGLDLLVDYTISLGVGTYGNYTARKMAFLTNRLNYNLYTSSAYTTVWGNGTGGTGTKSGAYLLSLGIADRYTVYGRIAAQQNVLPGAYTDSVLVTVNY